MATNATSAAPPRRDETQRVRVPVYPLTWQLIGASALVIGAGVIHFMYAPIHLAEARGQGIFFLVLAFTQVGWGAAALRNASPRTYVFGLVAASTMPGVLYLVSRFVAPPFSDEAEGFDIMGWAVLLSELGAAGLLVWHGLRQGIEWRNPDLAPGALAAVLVVAGLVGVGVGYGVGMAADAVVPWLGEPEGGEGDEDTGGGHATAAGSPLPPLPAASSPRTLGETQSAWLARVNV